MVKKRNLSVSPVDLPEIDGTASGSSSLGTNLSSLVTFPSGSATSVACGVQSDMASVSVLPVRPVLPSVVVSPPVLQSVSPPITEVRSSLGVSGSPKLGYNHAEAAVSPTKNYADLLKRSAQLQELGTPVEHVSGAPFVLIPDESIEAAKLEFKDFIYARFHGEYPSMGKIIGVVNAVWARTGPRIYVHNIGQGMYLLRVTIPKTREVLLSRTCWNIGGLPMFVAPWSPDYSPDEPPLTTAIVPVEMRNVPYLLFNRESLSRIATAVGKPDSLAPETERKENFVVAKLYVRVDLTAPLPSKIISGFSNGREVEIDVSYPWLPVKCDVCKKFGHSSVKCAVGEPKAAPVKTGDRNPPQTSRRRSKSRPGRSIEKKLKNGTLCYVPVSQDPLPAVTDTKTKTLQPPDVDLEEGEIRQVEEKVTPSQPPLVTEVGTLVVEEQEHEKNEARSAAFEEDTNFSNSLALSNSTVTPVADPNEMAITNGGVVLEASTANGGDSRILLIDSENDSIKLDPGSAENTILSTQSDFSDGSGSTEVVVDTNAAGISEEDYINHSVEEQERDNPFILVKNRKSGRKAAKRH